MAARRSWTQKQAEILRCDAPELAIDGGRRFGKTYTSAAAFLSRVQRRHDHHADLVRRGLEDPWPGCGMKASEARYLRPTVEAAVLTPRDKHLSSCRQYIMSYFPSDVRTAMLHPDLGVTDAGRQMWLVYGGVATLIRFVVASGITAVVSNALDVLWVDEAGLLDGTVMDAIRPVLWERQADLICSGTPSLGVEHWFTRMCLAGLAPDHPYYVPDVVEPDPRVRTVIGTSYEAFDKDVRLRAKEDAKRFGSAWESQWVLGDWRMPNLFIFDNFDANKHIVEYDPRSRIMAGHSGNLPPPSITIGMIDWAYSQSKPGACLVAHVWLRNPLAPKDRIRPLVIVLEDRQEVREYTADGWYNTFAELRDEHRVQVWYADPSREELLHAARRHAQRTGSIRPADKKDKPGRIVLLRSLLEDVPGLGPALYLTPKAKHTARQLAAYRWALDIDKEPTDRPIDWDDHCIDCLCFLVGVIMRGGERVPAIRL